MALEKSFFEFAAEFQIDTKDFLTKYWSTRAAWPCLNAEQVIEKYSDEVGRQYFAVSRLDDECEKWDFR